MLCASASLFESRILNCENLICRGIEEVITGLTRNQFVPKAHEGSNPSLCAKRNLSRTLVWLRFLFCIRKGFEGESVQSGLPVDVRDRGRPSA